MYIMRQNHIYVRTIEGEFMEKVKEKMRVEPVGDGMEGCRVTQVRGEVTRKNQIFILKCL